MSEDKVTIDKMSVDGMIMDKVTSCSRMLVTAGKGFFFLSKKEEEEKRFYGKYFETSFNNEKKYFQIGAGSIKLLKVVI
jgi:hypothetical protein